ncbi:hypothetical protein ERX46_04945 [Brumimicrobium glaciale]|uniref:DUF3037 domain-containing protein n=1 Tax=Brumimicrobium glaciale TaxID=200475 RepID=A0A4Q4KQ82_9FLAO|nr:hypothetical protein [Brumimicrobium glaciale]RYM34724.1 hypothetical protein ERX46_04945 [Brumimicrobium glaciale]
MESFYSIIYYKTNPLTDEMVSIGLLAGGGEGPFMYISNARLDLLKKVLHPNTFLSVRRHLKFLFEKVGKHRNEAAGILLFDPVFSVEQMDLLSQRSKNTIAYSQPTTINEWLDSNFFTELTKSFFGETRNSSPNKRPVFHLKWKSFYHSVKFKAWERDLPISSILPNSSLSLRIDLADLENKKIIKGIDFDLSETSLNRKLYELELISNALQEFQITIVYPTPKKNSGKDAFEATKDKFMKLGFQGFSEFKNLN